MKLALVSPKQTSIRRIGADFLEVVEKPSEVPYPFVRVIKATRRLLSK
jgi:hypothetical protein